MGGAASVGVGGSGVGTVCGKAAKGLGIQGRVKPIHRRAGSPVAENNVCLVERKSGEKDIFF